MKTAKGVAAYIGLVRSFCSLAHVEAFRVTFFIHSVTMRSLSPRAGIFSGHWWWCQGYRRETWCGHSNTVPDQFALQPQDPCRF